MVAILQFFVTYAPVIYILLAIGLVLAIRGILRARNEIHESIYGLEREFSRRHMGQAITALSIILLLGSAEFILAVFLIPNLPAQSVISTPTLNPLSSSTGTISSIFPGLSASGTQNSTPSAEATGCIPGQITITDPQPGDEISGNVILMGSADVPNFGFFKYEYAPRGSDNWSTIVASRSIVQDSKLGTWDTSSLATGDYLLRLVVTDNQGNALPACVIPVRVIGQ